MNLDGLTEVSIDGNNINVLVSEEADVSSLVASFTHSQKATVQIGDLKQISGITKNDFTNPLVYTVFAQDGSSKNYTITVVKPDPITGLEDAKTTDNIRLYPNPVTNKVTVTFKNKTSRNADIYIIDAMGRVLENHHLTELVVGENKRELFSATWLPALISLRFTQLTTSRLTGS